jgi:hypothetical protein
MNLIEAGREPSIQVDIRLKPTKTFKKASLKAYKLETHKRLLGNKRSLLLQ